MANPKNNAPVRRREPITDTQLLMTITICIFVCMYVAAMLIWGGGFKKPQMIFDILNDNAFLIIVEIALIDFGYCNFSFFDFHYFDFLSSGCLLRIKTRPYVRM